MAVFKGSRYEGLKLYRLGDKLHIESRRNIKFVDYDDNIVHTVIEGERIEQIANEYWGRPELYYIICDWNNIFDPLEDFIVGQELILPSLEKILEEKLWTF